MQISVETLNLGKIDLDYPPRLYRIIYRKYRWQKWRYVLNEDGVAAEFESRQDTLKAIKEVFGVDMYIPPQAHLQPEVFNNGGVINLCTINDGWW